LIARTQYYAEQKSVPPLNAREKGFC